jgi:hypothetical protein
VQHLLPAFAIFASGCLLIHVGRAYARATTMLLSGTALMLSVTLGTVVCQRIGQPVRSVASDARALGQSGQ